MSNLKIDRKRIFVRSILLDALKRYRGQSPRYEILANKLIKVIEMYTPQEIEDMFKERLYE